MGSSLSVESVGISELLKRIKANSWLVPSFQRDFVWSEADVTSLILSVVDARPIGMATLWEQPDDSGLELEPVSVYDTGEAGQFKKYVSDPDLRPKKFFAILDGRQRCTALAMAFGGLRPSDTRRRFAGRWFLDTTAEDATARVVFFKERDVARRGFNSRPNCIAAGLFPLELQGEELLGQWIGYLQGIMDPANYPGGVLPGPEELSRRNAVLKNAFDGINTTLLAVYIVPDEYGLGEICEIFETLNTTGTKVSTVDLLHSWLYNDSVGDPEPIQLRDWIDELGQLSGAEGWASRTERPELIAQIATASYALLDSEKPPARAVGRRKSAPVTSLRAGDLLATPSEFWREFIAHAEDVAAYLAGFQFAVSDSRFPYKRSPYPVTAAIYVALRWYMDHDPRYRGQWSQRELDAVFRAFFWRNALAGRYDQGFLTQSATDMKAIREILFARVTTSNSNEWAALASHKLDGIGLAVPPQESLLGALKDARPAGALGLVLSLPLWAHPKADLLDPEATVSYPNAEPVELHHLYPRDWCRSNNHGELRAALEPNEARFDFVNSVANLTPLSAHSNKIWRAKQPGVALRDANLDWSVAKPRFESHFINEAAYRFLTAERARPREFWDERAQMIAKYLRDRCEVHV